MPFGRETGEKVGRQPRVGLGPGVVAEGGEVFFVAGRGRSREARRADSLPERCVVGGQAGEGQGAQTQSGGKTWSAGTVKNGQAI